MKIDKALEVLIKDDPYDLYGDLTCIINPEGFDFEEGKSYRINGQGGLHWIEELGEWVINIGVPAAYAPVTEYGYNLHREFYQTKELDIGYSDIKIPADILVRHFMNYMEFDSPEDMDNEIIRVRRERDINKIL